MSFIVQTKKVVNVRGGIEDQVLSKTEDSWEQTRQEYDTFDKAKANALKLIDYGTHKAENIRILEVVCTFETEVKIKENIKIKPDSIIEQDYWTGN